MKDETLWLAVGAAALVAVGLSLRKKDGTILLNPGGGQGFAPGGCDPNGRPSACPGEGFAGYRPWTGKKDAATIGPWARELLDLPLGAETERYIDGTIYKSREECHFHPCGGDVKPWGWHKGTTIYEPLPSAAALSAKFQRMIPT